MQTGTIVLNRLSKLVINWAYVESIEFISQTNAVINYASGNSITVSKEDDVAALYDMVGAFPNIANDNTRKQMKQLSMANLPAGTQTDIADPTVGGHHGRPIEGPRAKANVFPKTDFPDRGK